MVRLWPTAKAYLQIFPQAGCKERERDTSTGVCTPLSGPSNLILAGLVAQSVMSATDQQRHWDRRCLSAADLHQIRPHYVQRCWHAIMASVDNRPPHVCA